jgi:hypothetical protein
VNTHPKCEFDVAGEQVLDRLGVQLPKRVIDVGDHNSSSVRLVIPGTSIGQYACLSHCWGDLKSRPTQTFTKNLSQYLTQILQETLPKTFQDAILITRQVGLRYLWIDSLCIVQDDKDDWREQAAVMGEVYRNAFLTIVAAHAENSSGGCFYDRSLIQRPRCVEVPYIGQSGIRSGSIIIKANLVDFNLTEHPIMSPISQRAWILQEEMLSRRKVYYTKGSLLWECMEIVVHETMEQPIFVSKSWDWSLMVIDYSNRSLTFQSDKLIALQGLASVMSKCRPGDRYVTGLWERDFPTCLLWFCSERSVGRHQPTGSTIPSWSWASRKEGISFLTIDKLNEELPHHFCTFSLNESGAITLTSSNLRLVYYENCRSMPKYTTEDAQQSQSPLFIARWPQALLASLRTESNIEFTAGFNHFADAFQVQWGFNFPEQWTYIITTSLQVALGYATLDYPPAEEETLKCALLRKGGKSHRGGWRYYYYLIVKQEVPSLATLDDRDSVWLRIGVAVLISPTGDDHDWDTHEIIIQ